MLPLYTPDTLAVARAAARAHFAINPVGRHVTGTCPCCQEPIDGICVDAYPACLDTAKLPFDLAVQTDIGMMLLVGDCATLSPGEPSTIRRVEPVPAADLRDNDLVYHGGLYDPAHSPLRFDPYTLLWGTIVKIRHRSGALRVSIRDCAGMWHHHTYPDPTTLVLRVSEVTAP